MTRLKATLQRLHPSSLFWRFLIVGFVALAPLIGAMVQFAGEERKAAIWAARQRAELLISYAVDSQNRAIDQAKVILRFLAEAPEVRSGGAECSAFLRRHKNLHRWIDTLRLSHVDGGEVCSDKDKALGPSIADRDFFDKVLKGADFVLSELVLDRWTGNLSMTAAVPILGGGRIVGVLSVGMNPRAFQEHSPIHIDPDLDVNMLVLDRMGTLIAHYPPVLDLVGTNLRDRKVAQKGLELIRGSAEAPDLFGTSRLFVYRGLPGTDAILAIGLNRAAVIANVDEALRYRLVLITVIVGGSLLLAMLGIESLVFRPVRSLVRTAESFEHGDFNQRSVHEGAGEVRILARALNRMAQAVAEREQELLAAKDVAEKALSQANTANRAKTDFLASMSHEIRTPLNGIIGYTEQMLAEKLNQRQRRYADLIQVSASALLTVANDILDFSSIESEQIRLDSEPFSLIALIDNTVSIVSSGAGRKGVPIRIHLDSGIPNMVLGDEARLRQILLNLLNNAVKFTREGHIAVHVQCKERSEKGERIRIAVADTGIGISPDKHDRLFKRFSQVDPSIRREFGGTGLGLAISKRLIELMGGEIGVESEQGRGATFWIELALPLADTGGHPRPETFSIMAMAPAYILLVEDVEINQELVQTLLVTAGHEVDIVSNGEDAIAAVQARRYDLVLMDIQMPGMDGITATRMIRGLDHPARDVTIVAMTANVLPQQVRSFLEAGINDHIGKPIWRDELLTKLSKWLPGQSDLDSTDEQGMEARPLFNEKGFEDFRNMIGADRVSQWLSRLDAQLKETLERSVPACSDRHQIARNAHALISQAALLGFSEFAELCTDLERACLTGEDISHLHEKLRTKAREVRRMIAGMEKASTS